MSLLLVLCVQVLASSVVYRDSWSSLNHKRPMRRQTRFIILHTTEGGTIGALEKLRRYGEAHYLVDEGGVVYRIIDRRRVAMHAGRSMWKGITSLDDHSIGIEVTGYHNRSITEKQIEALKGLLSELQRLYRIADENVMPHSMVAYGTPNRWHKRSHRGRKRCGMQFADRAVREKLGLVRQPLFDPDVQAGRLVEADPYLARELYRTARLTKVSARNASPPQPAATPETVIQASSPSEDDNQIRPGRSAWDIARDQYRADTTLYVFPDGTEKRGDEIQEWKKMPTGTKVIVRTGIPENAAEELLVVGDHGQTARDLAGEEVLAATTIYFMKDGRVRQGHELSEADVDALPAGTRLLVGYVHGGYVTARRTAFDIAGAKWNHSSTFYRRPDGNIVSGGAMQENAITPMSMIFFQR